MGNNKHQQLKIITWIFGLTLLWSVQPVLAITDGSVSIFPAHTNAYPENRAWFVYEAGPGEVIQDKIEIINSSNQTVKMNVAVLDGAVTNDGGYTLVGDKEQNKDIGNWATLSRGEVTLIPQSKQYVDLTITVPENADVGSHPGGVVIWRAANSDDKSSQSGLKIVTRVAARLYLTVPGDIVRQLDVENVRHTIQKGVLYFQMTMHNNGNVTLLPEADVTLKGIFGKVGTQSNSSFGMILRGGTINSQVPWQKKAPKFGRFVADFRIHYGEKDFKGDYVKDEYQDVRYVFWIIPWLTILWIALAILLLWFLRHFWLWIIIRQRLNTKTKKHTVKKGETLSTIAQLYGVGAKKIAKFNVLRWPYDLMTGDILLIPQGQMTKAEQKAQSSADRDALLLNSEEPIERWFKNIFHRQSVLNGRHAEFISASPSKILKRVQDDGLSRQYDGKTGVGLEQVIVEAGDTVKDVAEFAKVTPKEIIRLNHLHWPYRLRAGQELFIPEIEFNDEVSDKTKTKPRVAQKSSGASRLSTKTNKSSSTRLYRSTSRQNSQQKTNRSNRTTKKRKEK